MVIFAAIVYFLYPTAKHAPTPPAALESTRVTRGSGPQQANISPGGLVIKTTPAETQIYLDDVPYGITSPEGEIRLPNLQPGTYSLRVSSLGYESYEKPMTVLAGEEQKVSVTLVQKSTTFASDYNSGPAPEPLAPLGLAAAIPIPGIEISPVQFFEGPHDSYLDKSQRVYRTKFKSSTTRSIFWEIDLHFPKPGRRIDFTVDAIWYRPDGTELRHQTLAAYVDATWVDSWHTLGYGWIDAGHWPLGTYRVEFLFKGLPVSSGSFQVN
jgi:hypothetical protein